MLAPAPVFAKSLTLNDITLEVPAGFRASEANRGVELKTPDDEVFVWVETYKPDEEETIRGEHDRYWQKHKVVLKDPEKATLGKTTPQTRMTDYKGATWKGDPTVLRYYFVGPFGKSNKSILVTLWASPEGDSAHKAELQEIYDSISVKE